MSGENNLIPEAIPLAPGGDRVIPLVRQHRRLFRTVVVAFYDSHLLTGVSYIETLRMTEEMLTPEGEEALRSVLSRSRCCKYEEIEKLREAGGKYQERDAGIVLRPIVHKFKIRLDSGVNLRFTIPRSDRHGPSELLKQKLGDRYLRRIRQPRSPWLWLLRIILAVLIPLIGLPLTFAGLFSGRIGDGLFAPLLVLVGVFTTLAASVILVRPRFAWEKANDVPEIAPNRQRKTRAASGSRGPIRSKALGWTLKLVGLAYIVLAGQRLSSFLIENIATSNPTGGYIIHLLCWLPGVCLIYSGYRMCQSPYEPENYDDSRRKIVFLRPFEDDATTSLQPRGYLAAITGVRSNWIPFGGEAGSGERISLLDLLVNSHPMRLIRMLFDLAVDTSEEVLVRYFEKIGPVIAIGRPGEGLPTPGAARMYLEEEQWQQTVENQIEEAQIIVVQPGASEGVRWELEHLRHRSDPRRILMCLAAYWNRPDEYEKLIIMARQTLQIDLPRKVPYLNCPAFLYFDADWSPILQSLSFRWPPVWPLIGDATDLDYTLQPFLQGVHGGERERPRPAEWEGVIAPFLGKLIAAGIGFAIVIAGVYLTDLSGRKVTGYIFQSSIQPDTSEEQVARLFRESDRRRVVGKAVPYELTIPVSLHAVEPVDWPVEHCFTSADDKINLKTLSRPEEENLQNFAQQRLEAYSKEGCKDIRIESTQTVNPLGVSWIESRLYVTLANGIGMREVAYAHHSKRGTVMVLLQFASAPKNPDDDPNLETAYEILNSLRFWL